MRSAIKPLSCGERIVRCLTGQPEDDIPFGVGLGLCLWGETHARWRRESGRSDLDSARECGFERSSALEVQIDHEVSVARRWSGPSAMCPASTI